MSQAARFRSINFSQQKTCIYKQFQTVETTKLYLRTALFFWCWHFSPLFAAAISIPAQQIAYEYSQGHDLTSPALYPRWLFINHTAGRTSAVPNLININMALMNMHELWPRLLKLAIHFSVFSLWAASTQTRFSPSKDSRIYLDYHPYPFWISFDSLFTPPSLGISCHIWDADPQIFVYIGFCRPRGSQFIFPCGRASGSTAWLSHSDISKLFWSHFGAIPTSHKCHVIQHLRVFDFYVWEFCAF